MDLSADTGFQAPFDAWGVEEMTKAEERALSLRNSHAGLPNPDYDPSWFLSVSQLAWRQSRVTKNKLRFTEMMLVRHGFDPFCYQFPMLGQTQEQQRQDEEAPPSPLATPVVAAKIVFRKQSKAYDEFIDLVRSKNWTKKLPKAGADAELDNFMSQYGFSRPQAYTKFKEFRDLNNEVTEDEPDALNLVYATLLERAPPTDLLLKKVGESEAYRSITVHNEEHIPPELLVSLLDAGKWELLKGKILSLLSSCLQGKTKLTQVRTRSKRYDIKEEEAMNWFCLKYAEGNTQLQIGLYLLASGFISELQRGLTRGDLDGMSKIVESVLSQTGEEKAGMLAFEEQVAKRIYYIAGWILNASKKEATKRGHSSRFGEFLALLASNCKMHRTAAKESDLPTELVEEHQAFGNLSFPTKAFHEFISFMEAVSQRVLTPINQTIYGNRIVQELYDKLSEHEMLKSQVTSFVSVSVSVSVGVGVATEAHDQCSAILQYFVRTFLRMRGKDCCQRYMGDQGQSLTKGLRPTMAALSNNLFRGENTVTVAPEAPEPSLENPPLHDTLVRGKALYDAFDNTFCYDGSINPRHVTSGPTDEQSPHYDSSLYSNDNRSNTSDSSSNTSDSSADGSGNGISIASDRSNVPWPLF
jgi:hypothetical protein